MAKPTDLVQGTPDFLILRALALQPMHGRGIAQGIRQVSKEVLHVNQGELYPALHRLEQQGWIQAKWGQSENNRRAKFYFAGSGQREIPAPKTSTMEVAFTGDRPSAGDVFRTQGYALAL